MVCPFYSPNPCNIPFLAVNQIIQIIKNKLSKRHFLFRKKRGVVEECVCVCVWGGGGGGGWRLCVCVCGGGGGGGQTKDFIQESTISYKLESVLFIETL